MSSRNNSGNNSSRQQAASGNSKEQGLQKGRRQKFHLYRIAADVTPVTAMRGTAASAASA